MKFKFEKLNESFAILPSIGIFWLTWRGVRIYDISFQWLFWTIYSTNFKVILDNND